MRSDLGYAHSCGVAEPGGAAAGIGPTGATYEIWPAGSTALRANVVDSPHVDSPQKHYSLAEYFKY